MIAHRYSCGLFHCNASYQLRTVTGIHNEHTHTTSYARCYPKTQAMNTHLNNTNYQHCHPNNTKLRILLYQQNRYELCHPNNTSYELCYTNNRSIKSLIPQQKAMNTVPSTHKQCRPNTQAMTIVTQTHKLWILSHQHTKTVTPTHKLWTLLLKFACKLWTISPQHTSYEHCHPNTQAMKLIPAHSYIGHKHRYSTKTSNEHSPQQTVIPTTQVMNILIPTFLAMNSYDSNNTGWWTLFFQHHKLWTAMILTISEHPYSNIFSYDSNKVMNNHISTS